VHPLNSSRRMKFISAAAIVAAVGAGSGGWAYAASSGGAHAQTPHGHVHVMKSCRGLTLTPVSGVSAPKFKIETARPSASSHKLVICGAGGTAAATQAAAHAGDACPTLTPVPGASAPTDVKTGTEQPSNAQVVICGAGGTTRS
jgi:hypothetical protein